MLESPLFWIALNILSLIMLAFYSMMEMACVSFNKVRLQYYVSKNDPHAIRLNYLLQNPSRLFGTTLIGVNVAVIYGSEFARQSYAAMGINPDFSALTQVIIVLIFGELAPMFAARRYPEHIAMLGINLLYASDRIMTPFLWVIQMMTKAAHHLTKSDHIGSNIYLNQEELKNILEERDDERALSSVKDEFNWVVSNIFNLRSKLAVQVMTSLSNVPMLSSAATIQEMRKMIEKTEKSFLPVYHRKTTNIIGIAFPRDLVRAPDNRRVRDDARPPWFISQNAEILQILRQFRQNNEDVAVVLNEAGDAVGILTLEDIVGEIFGKADLGTTSSRVPANIPLIEQTLPANTKIADFNALYDVNLDAQGAETLGGLVTKILGYHPEEGEVVYVPPYELKIKEISLLEIKSITVKTRI